MLKYTLCCCLSYDKVTFGNVEGVFVMEKDYSMAIYPYLMVGIDLDTADDIVAKRLEQQFWELEPYIGGCPMFSTDKEENERLTNELMDAFIKVLEYNGVKIVKKRGKYVRRAK